MNFYSFLLEQNPILTICFTAWLLAPVSKTIINFILMKEFKAERLWGAGGMPSSHSALVCPALVATGREVGTRSPTFALALVLAAIVIYDAMGVRRAPGAQAKVLNKLLFDWMDENKQLFPNAKQTKDL